MKSKLDSCIKLETAIGEIYRELSILFPEAKELFEQLAADEANHAEILSIAKNLENKDELPQAFVTKLSSMVTEPLLYVEMLKHKLIKKQLSLQDALELSLKIEQVGAASNEDVAHSLNPNPSRRL